MKRRLVLLLTLVFALALPQAPAFAEENTYTIGICQVGGHQALEEATRGFTDAVETLLGDGVSLNVQSASGDSATCISIINAFLAEDVDLIVANATQALQAASAATDQVPILGVSITDFPAALDLAELDGATYPNVTGISDLAPLDAQAQLIADLFPAAGEVGLLYCSSEVNSQYQIRGIRAELEKLGYHCTDYAFTDTSDVFLVAEAASQGSDVVFVPTDNTIASCTELIRNVVEVERKPVVGGDEAICNACGVATISVDYYDLGYTAGEMACSLLTGQADIATTPVVFSPVFTTVYNAEMCSELGIPVPEAQPANP